MKTVMMMILQFLFLSLFFGCDQPDAVTSPETESQPEETGTFYFPPNNNNEWETLSIDQLGWNQNAVAPLKNFLQETGSRSFMILVNGRIVMEEYFNGQSANDSWEWNSAGKALVTAAVGVAQDEGLLSINDKVSNYLGNGWTSMPAGKEKLITLRHLLSMTSGIDDSKHRVTKANLTYLADAETRWAYGNVFQTLMDVVSAASGQSFDKFFNDKVRDKIGMDGYWNNGLIFTIYHSTARSMARFGLLALNKGKWEENKVIISENFFNESIHSSQEINPSYGYLWWLNGKSKYMIPGEQTIFNGALIRNAPADLYAAMGANDQRLYILPEQKIIILRMGEASDPDNPQFALSGFDAKLWEKINDLIPF